MKKVAINQSNYLPWKGYFDLMHDVDVFIIYDDVQFTVRDWRNRNKVKTTEGTTWLTVPVGADRNRQIREVTIEDSRWQRRHWETLRHAYGRAPHFKRYEDYFRWLYLERTWTNLSELNCQLIQTVAKEWLGIGAQFVDSASIGVSSRKQDRIFDLLRAVEADHYISGPAAKAYLDPLRFEREGIILEWKDYSGYPEYSQFHPPFVHEVSIVDLLFHTGPDAPRHIWGWRDSVRKEQVAPLRGRN